MYWDFIEFPSIDRPRGLFLIEVLAGYELPIHTLMIVPYLTELFRQSSHEILVGVGINVGVI